jgi:hypothetical protein
MTFTLAVASALSAGVAVAGDSNSDSKRDGQSSVCAGLPSHAALKSAL